MRPPLGGRIFSLGEEPPMQTVLITGASKGIGRQTALAFARAGYAVAAGYYSSPSDAATLLSQLRDLGADAETFRADISDRVQVKAAVETLTGQDCSYASEHIKQNNSIDATHVFDTMQHDNIV